MKRNNIYRRAAKHVFADIQEHVCPAIAANRPPNNDDLQAIFEFALLFYPWKYEGCDYLNRWLGRAEANGLIKESQMKEWRVMALLFMDAIVNYKERK